MKKTTKRVLSFALAVLMAFSISVPDGSYSRANEDEIVEEVEEGGAVEDVVKDGGGNEGSGNEGGGNEGGAVEDVVKDGGGNEGGGEEGAVEEGDHHWNDGEVITEPTCGKTGVMRYTCLDDNCGQTRTEEIPATGVHTWDKGTVTKEATCKEKGEKTFTCTVCGETQTEEIDIDPDGHVWDDGKITTEATCTTKGEKILTCTLCGATKTEEIPATGEHTWEIVEIVKEPTGTEDGEITYKCSACGETKTETVTLDEFNALLDTLLDEEALLTGTQLGSDYVYEITSNDRTATITDIVAALDLTDTLEEYKIESFVPVYAEPALTDGNQAAVTENEDGSYSVIVPGGGNAGQRRDAVKIYDKDSNYIVVYVYSTQVTIDESYTDAKFEVQWNDNHSDSRPTTDKACTYTLEFSTDGGTTYQAISEFGTATGLNDVPDYASLLQTITGLDSDTLLSSYFSDEDSSKWIFDLSTVGLPKKCNGETEISYRIKQGS